MKYKCPTCDFTSTTYDVVKEHSWYCKGKEMKPRCNGECKKPNAPLCGAKIPGLHCSRAPKHRGKHVACGPKTHELAVW